MWNIIEFWTQSYDRELQHQRCENLQRHVGIVAYFEKTL
jgi:hypothetical protein